MTICSLSWQCALCSSLPRAPRTTGAGRSGRKQFKSGDFFDVGHCPTELVSKGRIMGRRSSRYASRNDCLVLGNSSLVNGVRRWFQGLHTQHNTAQQHSTATHTLTHTQMSWNACQTHTWAGILLSPFFMICTHFVNNDCYSQGADMHPSLHTFLFHKRAILNKICSTNTIFDFQLVICQMFLLVLTASWGAFISQTIRYARCSKDFTICELLSLVINHLKKVLEKLLELI